MKAKHTHDVEALVIKYDKHIKTYLMEIATHEKIVNDLMEKYENKSSSYTPVKKAKETESSEMSNLKQMVKNLEQ
jgi:archaellum component FlaC